MSSCWCRFGLAILVIVFVWLNFSWSNIAITVLGALLAILALVGTCCCAAKRLDKKVGADTEAAG